MRLVLVKEHQVLRAFIVTSAAIHAEVAGTPTSTRAGGSVHPGGGDKNGCVGAYWSSVQLCTESMT